LSIAVLREAIAFDTISPLQPSNDATSTCVHPSAIKLAASWVSVGSASQFRMSAIAVIEVVSEREVGCDAVLALASVQPPLRVDDVVVPEALVQPRSELDPGTGRIVARRADRHLTEEVAKNFQVISGFGVAADLSALLRVGEDSAAEALDIDDENNGRQVVVGPFVERRLGQLRDIGGGKTPDRGKDARGRVAQSSACRPTLAIPSRV
jgi:hypothetical protein